MMLQLQPFKFTVYLANTLSRAALNQSAPSGPQEEVFQCEPGDPPEMFRIELETLELDSFDMYPSTLQEIDVEGRLILSCLHCVSLRPMVSHLTNRRFQRHSATTIRYGMS